jgi:7,8-dihydro-6-hydroxymethylpterin-pyrophosphokinase
MAGPQPMFLNAAATGESTLSARAALERATAVEQDWDGSARNAAHRVRSISI